MSQKEPYRLSVGSTVFLGWPELGRPDEDDPAERYHEASKNLKSVLRLPTSSSAPENDPQMLLTIPRHVKRHPTMPTVALPAPVYPKASLEEAIGRRRSRRVMGTRPVSLQELSTLLHATYGMTDEPSAERDGRPVRSVPSGGALYPLEIYSVVRNVEGLEPGLYHYDPLHQVLELLRKEDPTEHLREMMLHPPQIPEVSSTCAVVLYLVGIFWRTRWKYGVRGFRWVLVEAGHAGQNFVLAAELLGLSALPYGGFWDRLVDEFLGVDGVNESVVYSLVAGSQASRS